VARPPIHWANKVWEAVSITKKIALTKHVFYIEYAFVAEHPWFYANSK
jgi:hypothetical protein